MSAKQSGFSMIETLVAIAILALALAPLLDLQSQLARQGQRQRALAAEATATQSALALLSLNNPMVRREGRLESGSMQVAWRANALTAPVRSTRAGLGEGQFLVQLFETDVTVRDEDGRQLVRFTFEQIGWRQLTPDSE